MMDSCGSVYFCGLGCFVVWPSASALLCNRSSRRSHRPGVMWVTVLLAAVYVYSMVSTFGQWYVDTPSTILSTIASSSLIVVEPTSAARRGTLGVACGDLDACVSIHLFLYRRLNATVALMKALKAADYSSYNDHPIPLVVHVDVPEPFAEDGLQAEAQRVRQFVRSFAWPHGPVVLDIKGSHAGSKGCWLTAWTDPAPNDVMIAFEDDMMPSPLYFKWLMKVLNDYQLLHSRRDKNLLGISFSPIRSDKINYPYRPREASNIIGSKSSLYIDALPSSSGAAFFGDRWTQFYSFVSLRGSPPFYPEKQEKDNLAERGLGTKLGDPNLWLPDSLLSNSWVKSWERFLVDFAFGRGAYMLYPNLPNSAGFATSLCPFDRHSCAPSDLKGPRIAPLVIEGGINLATALPSYDSLPLLDLHGAKISRRDLARRGDDYLRRLTLMGFKYHALAIAWQRSCLLDDEQGNLPLPVPVGGRFLAFQPQMGLNNQFKAIVHGALWAHALGRTLVLPRLFWPRASKALGAISYADIFSPGHVASILPGFKYVYEDQDLLSGWEAYRSIRIESTPVFDNLTAAYLKRYKWDALPVVDLLKKRTHLSTIDTLYSELGSCNDQVMVLDGLYSQHSLKVDRPAALWKELFRPSDMLQRLINATKSKVIISKMGIYDCVHMRLGDFKHVCSGDSSTSPWLGSFRKKGWNCSVSPEQAISRTSRTSADAILVLSDDPEKALQLFSASTKRIITSRDIKNCVEQNLAHASVALKGVVSAVVEQILCADASHTILNAYSTFSRGIGFYRDADKSTEYW